MRDPLVNSQEAEEGADAGETTEKMHIEYFSTAKQHYLNQVSLHKLAEEKIKIEVECLKLDQQIKQQQKRKLEIELSHLEPLQKRFADFLMTWKSHTVCACGN